MSLKEKLTVSASPHVRSPETTTGIMLDVIISLIPALAASVWLFGLRTLLVTATTVLSCMLSEFFSRKIMKRQGTLGDLSAIVTGILLAFNLPATIPLWVAAIGSVVAIVVVKQFFGGIGQNFVNPALVGRIVLMASFPTMMSTWVQPFAWRGVQVVTTASPLASISSMFTAGGRLRRRDSFQSGPSLAVADAHRPASGLARRSVRASAPARLCLSAHPARDHARDSIDLHRHGGRHHADCREREPLLRRL